MSNYCETNANYVRPIRDLYDRLQEKGIPCQFKLLHDGAKLAYPSTENCVCSAVCNRYSYGHEFMTKDGIKNLIEILGLSEIEDDVDGYLTVDEVFNRIVNHYNITHNNK